MEKKLFVRRGHQVIGPFSKTDIEKAVSNKRLLGSDFVAPSRTGPWQLISESLVQDEGTPPEAGSFDDLLHEMIQATSQSKPALPVAAVPGISFDSGVLKNLIFQLVGRMNSAVLFRWAVTIGTLGIAMGAGVSAFGSRASLLGVAIGVIFTATVAHVILMRVMSENLFLFFLVAVLGFSINGVPAYLWVLNWLLTPANSPAPTIPEFVFWYAGLWQIGVGYYTTSQLVAKDEVPVSWCVFYYLTFSCVGLALVAILRPALVERLLMWLAQGL